MVNDVAKIVLWQSAQFVGLVIRHAMPAIKRYFSQIDVQWKKSDMSPIVIHD